MELLERESALACLENHLQQVSAGRGRLVFLAGEAGVGKSALVEEFRRRIADQVAVLRTSCDGLSTPGPLGPVRDLAPALGIQPERFPVDADGRDRLFRAVLDAFAAREEPLVVVAEDAHWADGASLELLRFLARRIGELRLLTVVTYRDDELGATHPLRLVLGDLATAPGMHRMALKPLSAEAVQTMAARVGRDGGELHRLTGGNPFFLTQVLGDPGTMIPATVADAVLARAARLSPEARAVLDIAAVIGTDIDPTLLTDVAGPVFAEIDECLARGLLRIDGDGLTFSHDLARVAIRELAPPPRRRLLHARVLAALRETPPSSGGDALQGERDLALLAHHAEAADDREAVLEFAVAAAKQAAALHAHREAAAQYARALRFADSLPSAERARLFEGRSIACYLSDQGEDAIAARRAALEIWRRLGNPLKEGDNLRWLSRVYWSQGQGAKAEEAATAALEVLEPLAPGPELAMAYSNLSQLRMVEHDLEATRFWGNRAIALAEQQGESEILVHALANVGTVHLTFEHARGESELQRSLQLSIDSGFLDHAARAMTCLAMGAMLTWRLNEADRQLATGIAYATEHDLDFYRWYLLAARATIRLHQSRWDAAEEEIRHLLQQPALSPLTRLVALTALGQVGARRGSPEAAHALDEALALAEGNGQMMRLGRVCAVRAEAALLAGDKLRARSEALPVRDAVFSRGNRWQRGEVAWLLWQAGDGDVPTDDLAEPHALQIDGDFAGAAAAWREIGCPYEEARALAESDDPDLVRRAAATFDRLGADPALRLAIRHLRALGVRDIPVLRRGPQAATRANAAGLTRRETEVLVLLAEGLRNAEIAERLYLAPKTVRHHVSVILTKLGVETRIEAARAAARLGLIPS